MSDRQMIRALMQGLVEKAGGVDVAAMLIGARLGSEVSKGSISKRNAGHLDWPLVEIMALEDAVGDRSVRRWLIQSDPEAEARACLLRATEDVIRESGEAASAAMAFVSGRGCEAKARKEAQEAVTATKKLADLLEAGE